MEQINFRKELKYLINKNDELILKERLKTILKKDFNTIEGKYKVLSLYFDDYKKNSYYQVVNGISERWKWRIRYYNYDTSFICLEKKYKVNGMTYKSKINITKKQVNDILKNKNIKISDKNDKLLNEFYKDILIKFLRPAVIIVYDRIPFTYNAGNVRITIDYNLSSSVDFDKFFDKKINLVPIMEKNYAILEVKYNDFIPDYIRYKLELNHLMQTSYSKFLQGILMTNKIFKGSE